MRKYANSREAKLEKRQVILDEVQRQFMKKSFDDIKVSDIASGAGVSKGTVFNYFESKETMFLTLLIREYGYWVDGFSSLLHSQSSMEGKAFGRMLTRYMDESLVANPKLFTLIALGHSHLEHNVSLLMAERYRRFINDSATEIGMLMAKCCPEITQIKGIKLMMTLHTFFVGHAQMAVLPTVMESNMALEAIESYEIDLRVTLLETLKIYLKGLLK